MLAPDTFLQNRYRIVRQLGQGGMGAVYEALDERLDTTVALKETLFTDERLRKQFEREARLLARMHHPALPRVSDHFSEAEGQFLVMQFIAGDDLAEMMKTKQGPFPIDQVLTWGDQLLDALDYLHTQDPQIIHRDIKPQNLKLTSRGQIILLDFGLAKGQTGGVSVVTTSASIFGYTPNYAPLEQIQGLGTDARSDIYALSATLYHLMTAVKPPDALTRAAALVNAQPDPLTPANEVNRAIGPEVASVIARGMSQNREQRYTTAAAMRAALKGTGEVATLTGKAEAATVLFQPPNSTIAEAPKADEKQTAAMVGETTVVHHSTAPRRRRIAPWAIAAAVLILSGVAFGGFYAFKQRNALTGTLPAAAGDPSPIATHPSPSASSEVLEPTAGGITEGKVPETSARTERAETKRNEKTTKATDKIAEKATAAPTASPLNRAQQYPGMPGVNNTPARPETPPVVDPDFTLITPNRRQTGTTVRNLPDGSRITIYPDGTRVLVSPNGNRRVLRPGERILRRRG